MAKKIILTEEELAGFLKKEKFGFVVILIIFLFPFLVWVQLIIREFYKFFEVVPSTTVVIPDQSGFMEIVQIFSEKKIVPKISVFKLYLLVTGKATKIKSGAYVFEGTQTVSRIADKLIEGPDDVTVVIPEGYTVFDIDKKLSGLGLVPAGSIVELSQKPELFDYQFLRSDQIYSLEGFLFPDTYRFSQKTTPEAVVQKMLDAFQRKVFSQISPDLSQEPASFYNILKLASFIEKEVTEAAERRMVADILWKRLENDMLLQVDASVVYAWRIINPEWKLSGGHTLTEADIKIKSPYNSYIYKGLPPTPIANPGLEAIKAVLNPEQTDYWYYLSTREGKTIFSKTLSEHTAAKKRYLK